MRTIVIGAFSLAVALSSGLRAADSPSSATYRKAVQPVLSQHCYRCHGAKKQEGDLRLDNLSIDLSGPAAETWHDVLGKLNRGEMPPEKEPPLVEKQRQPVVRWLTEEIKLAVAMRRSTGGRVVLRRLTRYEYNNTMRDLLGINLDFGKDLPPEPTSPDGFQNNGAMLGTSPLQIEFYLQAARTAMSKAIVVGPKPEVHRHSAEKSEATRRKKETTSDRLVTPDQRFLVKVNEFPREGDIVVRVLAGADVPEGAPHPRMKVSLGVRSDTVAPEAVLGEADVVASADDPQVIEFRGRIENFPLPGHNPKFPGLLVTVRNVSLADSQGKPKKQPKPKKGEKPQKGEEPKDERPAIVVKSLEFEGPVLESWPPPSHARIFQASEHENDEAAHAREILENFMRRAYRRPVAADEVDFMKTLFDKIRPRAASFEEAMREVLAAVLVSPEFLYLMEPRDDAAKKKPLTSHELASRLSYFLWSSMPD
ncbi:MAG: DUF1587 domain-containing protein, partial [Planctomycetales bacterium]